MPVEEVGNSFHKLHEISLYSFEKAEVDVTVFNDIDIIVFDTARNRVYHIIEHTFDILRALCHNSEILMTIREYAAEYFAEKKTDCKSDIVVCFRELDAEDSLVMILSCVVFCAWVLCEVDKAGRTKVVVIIHFQIACCCDIKVVLDECDFNIHNIADGNDLALMIFTEMILSHLTVIFSAVIKVGSTSQNNTRLRGHVLCHIILAVVCDELTRKDHLCHMAEQLCIDIALLVLFIFKDEVGILERIGEELFESLLADCVLTC